MIMRLLTITLLTVALSLTATGFVVAAEVNSNAGTSGFSFLKINVGARAVSMGGAFTGLADDESSLYYNPAGLAGMEKKRFIGGYHHYFADMQSGFVGVVTPINFDHAIGFYISYLNYGDFTETDLQGNVLGDFGGGDLLFGVAGAYSFSYELSVGGAVKFIYEKLEDFSATGLAADMGVRYTTMRERLVLGAAVQHLGFQMSSLGDEKDKLPLTFRGGGSIRPRGLPMVFSSDLIIPIDNDPVIAIGTEYYEIEPLYLRIGWNSFGSNYRTGNSGDSWAGLALGLGFDVKDYHISYAFAPGAELGESHRITFTGGI